MHRFGLLDIGHSSACCWHSDFGIGHANVFESNQEDGEMAKEDCVGDALLGQELARSNRDFK